MHHRRRSRRRDKRVMAPCGCCETNARDTDHPGIDDNEVCNGRPKRKKPRPKKDKCPVNGTHEWYKEWTVQEHTFGFDRSSYKFIKWSEDVLEHTCIHCWKTKIKKYRVSRYSYRDVKRTLPKRPIKELDESTW